MGLDNFRTQDDSNKVKGKQYTEEELLNELRRYYAEYGSVKAHEFKHNDDYPSSSTISYNFGSWNNGLKEAGIPINKKSGSTVGISNGMLESSQNKSYILGVLLGDGGVYSTSDSLHVRLTSKDKDFCNEFAKRLCSWFSVEWHGWDSQHTNISCMGPHSLSGNREDVYVVTKSISKDLYDYLNNLIESNAKSIDEEISPHYNYLVRGLWDSEGHLSNEGKVKFTTTDEYINNLYTHALSCSLEISVERLHNMNYSLEDDESFKSDTAYIVQLPKSMASNFFNEINPTIERKVDKYHSIISK